MSSELIESVGEKIGEETFSEELGQKFLELWCQINDGLKPKFISREEWEEKDAKDILVNDTEDEDENKKILYIPENIKIDEMFNLIAVIDHDTFPGKQTVRTEQILKVGSKFEKAGIYLNGYLSVLEQEKDVKKIAEELSNQFYKYGLSLQKKQTEENKVPGLNSLSALDKSELDEWFLGKTAYQKRLDRLNTNPTEEDKETLRKRLLSVYFKALTREGYKEKGNTVWEYKDGPIQRLQDKTQKNIVKSINLPADKLIEAIFDRGVEKLITGMKDPQEDNSKEVINNFAKDIGFYSVSEKRKLYDTLGIQKLKNELDELKLEGDVKKISEKELEIAKRIQNAVRNYDFMGRNSASYPAEILTTQLINCVGASILGGGLLEKVGINYYSAILPKHSSTVLHTTDGKLYWLDFTPSENTRASNFTEITHDMLVNNLDINNLTDEIENKGLSITFKDWNPYSKIYSKIAGSLKVNLFNPRKGLQAIVLNNIGATLNEQKKVEEAEQILEIAKNMKINDANIYLTLGIVKQNLKKEDEAIEAYIEALNIDIFNAIRIIETRYPEKELVELYKHMINIEPQNLIYYDNLINNLKKLGDREEELIDVYKQAISIKPTETFYIQGLGDFLKNIGREDEVVETFRKLLGILMNTNRDKEAYKVCKELHTLYPEVTGYEHILKTIYKDFWEKDKEKKLSSIKSQVFN